MRIPLTLLLAACGTQAEPRTWHGDIEPLAFQHCVSCHQPGGVGPGDWTDPAVVAEWAPAIAASVADGRMPPPVVDPGCREYVGSERLWMTDETRALFAEWAEQGTPMGDLAEQNPDLALPSQSLADANVPLVPSEVHTLDLDESGNAFHCMVVDNPFTETTYVTGFDVEIDNREVVHHMLLAIDANGDAGIEYGTDGTEPSFACDDQVIESDWSILHAWTPGMAPVEFPADHGMKIEPGQQLVLQMHYFGRPDGDYQDASGYRLRTADAVGTEVFMAPFGPTGFVIPPGAKNYSDADSITNTAPFSLNILGAFPHMHVLGTGVRAWIDHGASETCLLDGAYDFNNQLTYMFEEPATFAPGDQAWMECTWDNSLTNSSQLFDPPQEIRFGEGSDEEMCFLLTYVTL